MERGIEKTGSNTVRDGILAWADQFKDDHYVFDVYGEKVTADVPRDIVEAVLDISILLVDRVVASRNELRTAEYEALEERVRKQHPDDGKWLLHVVMEAFRDQRLFGRYKDIEPMIGKLGPRGYPMGTAAYLLLVRPELRELIYAVIRHVDDVVENYDSLVYTFFIGTLTKGWGTGFGWSMTEEGWEWRNNETETR